MNHHYYMQEAFRQARFAVGGSDPNPPVGAVIVNPSGEIIGRGFTQRPGNPHAEVMAIRDAQAAGYNLQESSIYVTLEPCCHWGRTPPCTEAILTAGLRRVVIANRDFSPEVAGRSVEILRQQGCEIILLPKSNFSSESHWTLGAFSFRLRYQRPAIVGKWAQTLDGYLAPEKGSSGPITSPLAHALVQRLRRFFPVIVTGPGTVVTDHPRLTRRATTFEHNYDLAEQNFLGQLLARFEEEVPLAAYEGAYHRYFILPRNFAKAKPFLMGISPSQEDVRLFTVGEVPQELQNSLSTSLITQPSYPQLWNSITDQALQDGANALLVETGPSLAESLLTENRFDALYVFIGEKSSQELFFQKPRTLPAAQAIANQAPQLLETYGLKLRCRLFFGQEQLLYFASENFWQI